MKILVVEDDPTVAQTLELLFSNYNYAVDIAADGESGLQMVESFEYDLLLLDVILPRLNGISLCQQLRACGFKNPILLLTGQGATQQKAIALNTGADDYVVKPFDTEELIARVQALLRRGGEIGEPVLSWGKLSIDPSSRTVTYGTSLLSLTSKEYAILELFLRSPQKVLSASAILDRVWTSLEYPGEEAVRVRIKELRQKLTAAGAPKNFIKTQYRVGYQLNPLYVSVAGDRLKQRKTQPKVNASNSSNEELHLALEQLQATRAELERKNQELEIAHQTIARQQHREEALGESEIRYRTLFEAIHEGFSVCELVRDEGGCAVDYRFLELNPAAEKIIGISRSNAIGRLMSELLPGIDDWWSRTYQQVVDSGESMRFKHYLELLDRWFDVTAVPYCGDRFIILYEEITERKQVEAALKESEAQLAAELADTKALQHISNQLINETSIETLYEQLLNAAIAIARSDMGSMQIFDLERNQLRMVLHRGFDPTAVTNWEWLGDDTHTVCALALATEKRAIVPDIEDCDFIAGTEAIDTFRSCGIKAAQSTPLISRDGRLLGMISNYWRKPHQPSERELNLIDVLARQAADLIDRARNLQQIESDLKDTQLLHQLAARLVTQEEPQPLYQEILEVAIALTRADAGTVQILDETTQELVMLATSGFTPELSEHFHRVSASSQTSCGKALATGGRTSVDFDVPQSEDPDGSFRLHLEAGYCCAQSTPLISHSGKLIGMVSTHWRECRRARDRELQFLDLLARQAADALAREQTAAALRDREELLRTMTHAGLWSWEVATGQLTWSPEMYRLHGLDLNSDISNYPCWFNPYLHPEDRHKLAEDLAHLLAQRTSEFQGEYRIVHPQQGIRWLLGVARPTFDDRGEVVHLSGITLDITDRKEAEIALQESEVRFRHFAENSHALIWMTKSTSCANQYASSAYETIWGRSRQSLIEQPESWLEAIHPEDLALVEAQLEQKRQGRASTAEYRLLRPDGSVRWISSASFPIRNEAGETYGFGGIAEDISDRKLAENALQASEARFSAAFNYAAIGMALLDPQGCFLQVNPALCELIGYSEAELIGMNFAAITHPDDLDSCLLAIAQLVTGKIGSFHREKRYFHKQGHIIWVFVSTTLVRDEGGQLLYFIGQMQDISDRKQAEFRLQQQVQRERLVADIAGDIRQSLDLEVVLSRTVERVRQALDSDRAAVFHFRPDWCAEGIVESVREGWLSLLGTVIFDRCFSERYAERFLQGQVSTISDIDSSHINSCYVKLLKPLQVRASLVVPIVQGERLWGLLVAHHCAAPHHWQAWEVDLLEQLATHLSIAIQQSELYEQTRRELLERKAAQQKIKEQAALLDITSDAIFVRDFEHRILYWNRSAEQMYGWSASEALGRKANELLGENAEQISEITQILLDLGEWHGELRKIAKTGREVTVEGRWTLARDGRGQPQFILSVNTDITDQKQLETQFYRVQRLESLGTLASGIAHDLNNVLTPVVAISQVLRLRLPDLDPRSLEMLRVLEESAKRGAKTLEQILTFTRGRGEECEAVSIIPLLQEVVSLIQPTLPKLISILQTIPNPVLGRVWGNSTHLQQVFMNLCVNARDAMPDGGILSLSVEQDVVDRAFTQTNLEARVGDYIVITVADTGTGIPPEVRDRIFEPFFTTKPLGQGTGLGLATVLGIVKNYGGFVQVNSEVGGGTEVKVYLPVMEGNTAPTRKRHYRLEGDGEIIAVVDDDLAVLESTRSLLECRNYTVLSASRGAEAIALYERHQHEIRAIVVDMTMPEMSGTVVIQRLKAIDPDAKIIAMSGLSVNRASALDAGADIFISKPYNPDMLLERLQILLTD